MLAELVSFLRVRGGLDPLGCVPAHVTQPSQVRICAMSPQIVDEEEVFDPLGCHAGASSAASLALATGLVFCHLLPFGGLTTVHYSLTVGTCQVPSKRCRTTWSDQPSSLRCLVSPVSTSTD